MNIFSVYQPIILLDERQRKMIYQTEGREIALGSKLFRFYTLYIFKIVPQKTKLNYRIKAMRAHTAFFSLIFQGGAVQAPSFICKKKHLLLFLHYVKSIFRLYLWNKHSSMMLKSAF